MELIRQSRIYRELIEAGVPEHHAEHFLQEEPRTPEDGTEKMMIAIPAWFQPAYSGSPIVLGTSFVNLEYVRDPEDRERWVPNAVHAAG